MRKFLNLEIPDNQPKGRATLLSVLACLLLLGTGCGDRSLLQTQYATNTVGASAISGQLSGYSSLSTSSLGKASDPQGNVGTLSCASPQASLYKIDSSGVRIDPAVASVALDSQGKYSFPLKNLNLQMKSSAFTDALLVVISGCSSALYSRPLTGFTNQDVTAGSSLLGYVLNTDQKDKFVTALLQNPTTLQSLLGLMATATDVAQAYTLLSSSSTAQSDFTQMFGAAASVLVNASPEIISKSMPTQASELAVLHLDTEISHWSSSYPPVYQWKLDSTVIANSKTFDYTPTANAQGTHTLTLVIGQNDGAGGLDATKPQTVLSQNLLIANNVLPVAPAWSISVPTLTSGQPTNTRALTLSIATGANKMNCATFSSMAITENTLAIPPAASFTQSCSQNGTQNVSYNLVSAGDGVKTLRLWVIDSAGVISAAASTMAVSLDTTVPTLSIATTLPSFTKDPAPSFTFSGADGIGSIDHFECQLDAAVFSNCVSPTAYSGLIAGAHSFSVKAIDTAGNISGIVTKNWQIDLTLPLLSVSGGPASITNVLTSTFLLSATDSGGSGLDEIQCRIDGGTWSTCLTSYTNIFLAGTHTLQARSLDVAGNVSATQSYTWIIDTTPPATSISAKPATTTNSQAASFSFAATDSGGGAVQGYECKLDAGSFASCTSPKTYASLAAGSHSFAVRATDTAGNVETPVTYTWNIDLTTPVPTISTGPSSITNQTTASFSFAAATPPGGSITGYQCSLDAAAWGSCSSPKTYSSLLQGSHTFQVRAVDNNTNQSTAASFSWTLDTTAPTLSISSAPAAFVNLTTTAFSFSGSDTGGGSVASYQCSLDGAAYAGCVSGVSYSGLSGGSHSFAVQAVDTAGNTSTAATSAWTVDVTSPVLNISSPAGPYTGGNATTSASTVTLSWTLTENNVSSTQNFNLDYSLDNGGTWTSIGTKAATNGPLSSQSFNYSWTVPVANSSQVKVRVSYTDLAGNTAAITSGAFTIDSIAPTVATFQLAGGSATTALPTVSTALTTTNPGTAATAISDMMIRETATAVGGTWIPLATSSSFMLSQTSGQKSVYIWVRDAAGNISAVISPVVISLDFGQPPVASILTPGSSDTFTYPSTVPISWSCAPASGSTVNLDAHPISKIQYSVDDGATFVATPIAVDLTNNDSATTGHYNWPLPSGVTSFRLLLSCKSEAGVVSTAFSQPINTGWSVFIGDPTASNENISATSANVATSASIRSTIVADKDGNIFYSKGQAIMRIDAQTGFVTRSMGSITSYACTITTGINPLTNYFSNPVVLGANPTADTIYISDSCGRVMSVRTSDMTVLNIWSLTSVSTTSGGRIPTMSYLFFAGGRYLLFFGGDTGNKLFKLDVGDNAALPVLIHGNGTALTGAPTLSTSALSMGTGSGNNTVIFSTPDTHKIWIQGFGSPAGSYRIDDSAGTNNYIVGSAAAGWNNSWDGATCADTRFDHKIYCAGRWVGLYLAPFNLQTESWETTITMPFANNDASGFKSFGSANTRLLSIYSLNVIQSIDTAALSSAASYVTIAGQPMPSFGNGNDKSLSALSSPGDIKYHVGLNALYIFSSGHARKVDFADSLKVSTIYQTSGSGYSANNMRAMSFNLAGTKLAWYANCGAGMNLVSVNFGAAMTGGSTFLNGNSCAGVVAAAYPPSSPATASVAGYNFNNPTGVTGNIDGSVHSPLYHSNGKMYFASYSNASGNGDVFLWATDGTNMTSVAGQTGTATYNSGDTGKAALGASFKRIYQLQEIPSGVFQGDILVWDSDRLRRISVNSVAAGTACPNGGVAPCVYDVVNFTLAAGYTAGTSFSDVHYDMGSEISGVLGSGNLYYVTSSNVVRKFHPTAVASGSVSTATDTAYIFTGTTLGSNIRIEYTPLGLLVLQPDKVRVLRIAP